MLCFRSICRLTHFSHIMQTCDKRSLPVSLHIDMQLKLLCTLLTFSPSVCLLWRCVSECFTLQLDQQVSSQSEAVSTGSEWERVQTGHTDDGLQWAAYCEHFSLPNGQSFDLLSVCLCILFIHSTSLACCLLMLIEQTHCSHLLFIIYLTFPLSLSF